MITLVYLHSSTEVVLDKKQINKRQTRDKEETYPVRTVSLF